MARRSDAFRKTSDYRLLRRIVAGQVRSTINDHPRWFTRRGARSAPNSVAKRVAGEVAALLWVAGRVASGGGVWPASPCAHPLAGGDAETVSAPGEGVGNTASSPFLRDIRQAACAHRAAAARPLPPEDQENRHE